MKKNKKLLLILLALVIAVQLITPIGALIVKKTKSAAIDRNGEIFKIKIRNLSYYNYGYDDATIDFSFEEAGYALGTKYAVVSTGADGFAEFTLTQRRPKDSTSYIKGADGYWFFTLGEDAYKMKSFDKLEAVNFIDEDSRFSVSPGWYIDTGVKSTYIEAKIYNGEMKIIAVYVDGVNLETVLSEYNENIDAIYNDMMSEE